MSYVLLTSVLEYLIQSKCACSLNRVNRIIGEVEVVNVLEIQERTVDTAVVKDSTGIEFNISNVEESECASPSISVSVIGEYGLVVVIAHN